MQNLNEKFAELLESDKFAELSASDTATMAAMLENTEKEMDKMVSEGTLSGDVAQFTPILMPMVRRVYPNLIANEILGVQPMAMPTGFIYALTNSYAGTDNTKVSPLAQGVIVEVDSVGVLVEGTTITGNNSGAIGTVAYTEDNKVLVDVTSGTFTTLDTACTNDVDASTTAILAIYTNEAAFGNILKSYTGTYTTAQAELLGKDMKEVGFSISKKSVEAKSRALKGQYSVEMYQDLKAQHGLLADEEIMSLMSYELQAEIDREIVDFVNSNATNVANASDIAFSADSTDGTGRWEIEKYRREVIKISKESKIIGLDTKRGTGNTLIVSPQVLTMLEQVGSFKVAEQTSGVINPVAGGVAGTFDNKYKVIVDQYAQSEYATVMYKGADRRDAMGFFAPYVPLSFTKVTHADSGQPAVIAKTRYALDTIPGVSSADSNDRAQKYARTFGVNFANTALV